MLCDVGYLFGRKVFENPESVGVWKRKGDIGPKECLSELASDIFGLLLLCDGDELHRRNQLLSLEKSGPENDIKGVDHKALFLDDG